MLGKLQERYYFISSFTIVALAIMMPFCCYGQAPDYSCPISKSISPCTCSQYYNVDSIPISNRIVINCKGKNMTDLQMGKVLNGILSSKGLSPVIQISAANNQLTKIPEQVSKFTALSIVDLSQNQITEIPCADGKPLLKNSFANQSIDINLQLNQITRIPSGVFHFSSAFSVIIDLSNNKIASIPSDAFRLPSTTLVYIILGYNQISAIPDGVFNFRSALYAFIFLVGNKISEIPPGSFNLPLVKDVSIYLRSNEGITTMPSGVFNFPLASDRVVIDISMNNIQEIPCGTFNYPTTSSVFLFLHTNQIKTISVASFNFPSATRVHIALSSNLITTIPPGVFHFPSATEVTLGLGYNQISTIPPDTFAQGSYSSIWLANNKLKRFESSVFKSVLNKMLVFTPTYNSLDITGNPIDCLTDPCHLAWLSRSSNSSQVLSKITGNGVCSNNGGPPFSALNSFDFNKNCPCYFN